MKFISNSVLLCLCLFLFGAATAQATIDITLQMQLGNPSGAIADPNNHNHYLVQRTVEALDYSDVLGEPVWASWDLTAADIGNATRSTKFFPDTNLPSGFYEVTDNDYNGVGNINFTRGHMCPSEDRTDTDADNDMVFFMSNIVPQSSANNSGVWEQFEDYCRTQVQTSSYELLIICGPSGFGTNRIPSGKAVIATNTWKIAMFVPAGSGTALSRITSATRVVAIKVPNDATPTAPWQKYITSASQIEVDTGFTFFTALPSDVAATLRSKVDGQAIVPTTITSFSPTSGAAGTNVIITGTNFNSASAVTFNGVSAVFLVDSNTQITATVPLNAASGFISVTTTNGTAVSSSNFTVIGGSGTFTGTLAGWDVNGVTGFGPSPFAANTAGPNLAVVGLTRGPGITTSGTPAGHAWGGTGFSSSDATSAIAANKFVTFSIMPTNGSQVSFSSISRFDYRGSSTGPTGGLLQFQVGSGAFSNITTVVYSQNNSSGTSLGPIDLSSFTDLQNVGAGTNVTFRFVNYGGGSSGNWYIFDKAGNTAPDLALSGTVITPTLLSPLEAWRLQYFGITNNAGGAADSFATTSDGMPNLLKYALGLNPTNVASNPIVYDIATGFPRLTAPRNTNATDVTLGATVSGDLMNWTTNGTVIDQDNSIFQVHDNVSVMGGTNRFMRLLVTSP